MKAPGERHFRALLVLVARGSWGGKRTGEARFRRQGAGAGPPCGAKNYAKSISRAVACNERKDNIAERAWAHVAASAVAGPR